MFPAIFPGLSVSGIERIGTRNAKAVLAWLLRDSGEPKWVKKRLTVLKYPGDIFDMVAWLLELYRFDPQKLVYYLQRRDLWKQTEDLAKKHETEQDIRDFARLAGMEEELHHFLAYQPQAHSQDFLHLTGAEIGRAIAQAERQAYEKSKAPR
jgi:hypothetical protein